MAIALITGSSGLIGSESVRFFHEKGFDIVGIDNNMRQYFFGKDGSTIWVRESVEKECRRYTHFEADIRNFESISQIFSKYRDDIKVVIHTAAQPSHDWSAQEPLTDFHVNAVGTINVLESVRLNTPDVPVIFTSTNKVYGDKPNTFPLVELEKRYEIEPDHPYFEHGFDEMLSIDQNKHSIFGASKVAADVMAQEYARHYGLKIGVFRGGCLTGPGHSSVELHGFLSYLAKCAVSGKNYTIYGYKGKQVRDNIHSYDLVNAFWHFYNCPKPDVYNIGGGRYCNCSVLEAMDVIRGITGKEVLNTYTETNRIGDPIWLIGDIRRFRNAYPNWDFKYDLKAILSDLVDSFKGRH